MFPVIPSYHNWSIISDPSPSHRSCAEATKKLLLFIRCRHRENWKPSKRSERRCENSKAMWMFWGIEANAWNPCYGPLLGIWTSKRTKMDRTKILWIDLMHFIYSTCTTSLLYVIRYVIITSLDCSYLVTLVKTLSVVNSFDICVFWSFAFNPNFFSNVGGI